MPDHREKPTRRTKEDSTDDPYGEGYWARFDGKPRPTEGKRREGWDDCDRELAEETAAAQEHQRIHRAMVAPTETKMTGAELKQLRHDLSDAIGRRLSTVDMARICGLKDPERNGKDTYRKWEDGDGPSGPVAALMSLLAYASDRHDIPQNVSHAGYAVSDTVIDQGFREMILAEIKRRLAA